MSENFNFVNLLASATTVREWTLQHHLPADEFSTENGVIVTRGSRWPLMIDPQEQVSSPRDRASVVLCL